MAEALSDCDRGPLNEAEDEISEADAIVPDTGSARRPLGSLLTGAGHITEEQLAEGLREGKTTGRRLGEVVVLRGWVTEDVVAKLLAEQWALGYVERASIFFDVEALSRLSREQAQSLGALPTRVKDGRVVVAVAEPTEERLAALRAVIGDDTVVVVIPKTALDAGLRSELLSGGSAHDATAQAPPEVLEAANAGEAVANEPLPPAFDAPAADPPVFELAPFERPKTSAGAARSRGYEPPAAFSRVELQLPRSESSERDLGSVVDALERAAGDTMALQLRVGELARRLAGIANDVAAAAEQLQHSRAAPDA
jgi:type II secretion system (T2SS) protein E